VSMYSSSGTLRFLNRIGQNKAAAAAAPVLKRSDGRRHYAEKKAAAAASPSAATPSGNVSTKRKHDFYPRLHTLLAREQYEETMRDELPIRPSVPRGWKLDHKTGSSLFVLEREILVEGSPSVDHMKAIAHMEIKVPEKTYRHETGERTEQMHLCFELFVSKPSAGHWSSSLKAEEGAKGGGLEFQLTSIDSELILDGVAIHSSHEHFLAAQEQSLLGQKAKNSRYRGPYMNELDEDLTDEMFDYLDDRGVNNVFAEYLMSQSHFFEQEEYLNWLKLLKRFVS
jgi:hypothetical protein